MYLYNVWYESKGLIYIYTGHFNYQVHAMLSAHPASSCASLQQSACLNCTYVFNVCICIYTTFGTSQKVLFTFTLAISITRCMPCFQHIQLAHVRHSNRVRASIVPTYLMCVYVFIQRLVRVKRFTLAISITRCMPCFQHIQLAHVFCPPPPPPPPPPYRTVRGSGCFYF